MRWLPRSLRGRLLASAALFTLLALIATGVVVQVTLHRFVQGQVDQRLDTQLMTVADALMAGPEGHITLSRNVDGPPFDDPRSGWTWRAETATQVWQSGARPPLPPAPPLPPGRGPPPPPGPPGEADRDHASVVTRMQVVEVAGQPVMLAATAPRAAVTGPMREALRPLAATLLVLGAGLALATLIQVRIGLRPLADLRRALAAVRTGQAERLPAEQPAELGPLVAEMNSLLDQNAANLERARRHVANLAHALKTPLASLTLALDRPERGADRPLLELAGSMDRRIRHHLARARAAALGGAARHGLALAPRIADHVAAFAKIHADKALGCDLDVPAAISVACDPQDLDEIVGNVLDNAFKWARSRVAIAAVAEGKSVRLSIEDDGPGIPLARRDEVLRPGQRLDETMPGDGFGLAIVGELVELYGGTVALGAARLGGLQVTLSLPSASGA